MFYIHIFKEPHAEKKKHGVLETNTAGDHLYLSPKAWGFGDKYRWSPAYDGSTLPMEQKHSVETRFENSNFDLPD